ncbi:hypothetical protein GCM10010298_40680 [Streptomyces microflavus]|uniref:Uncharacterized protein n=2 Tax=Streptomyces TaxID=1883 RepID=A0A7J0D0N6_STRMI|nr:hypothetical protein Smic_68620 [Streptomyces microflavus]GGX71701.1 hypothetical protein GCM10010298_40680 [Streptomyces microflavus]
MRIFSTQGREFAALIILSDYNDYESMEVVEMTEGKRGELLLEFRFDSNSARLSFIRPEVEIPLLRASLEIFREEFLEPRISGGLPYPPW